MQTAGTSFRRDNLSQVWLPRQAGSMTGIASGTQTPVERCFVAGLGASGCRVGATLTTAAPGALNEEAAMAVAIVRRIAAGGGGGAAAVCLRLTL